ncbi:hypothetical protein E2C01_089303 [Portunus trituberculatus]|uniref:Uncharacterized protein n=1 Tax=Portunus trituberculatus TaxID=210409 RepID=A0A5B7JGV1_PORTR|nr:hypothetical protein [Portunus trituberculatus]
MPYGACYRRPSPSCRASPLLPPWIRGDGTPSRAR